MSQSLQKSNKPPQRRDMSLMPSMALWAVLKSRASFSIYETSSGIAKWFVGCVIGFPAQAFVPAETVPLEPVRTYPEPPISSARPGTRTVNSTRAIGPDVPAHWVAVPELIHDLIWYFPEISGVTYVRMHVPSGIVRQDGGLTRIAETKSE